MDRNLIKGIFRKRPQKNTVGKEDNESHAKQMNILQKITAKKHFHSSMHSEEMDIDLQRPRLL